jgi:hypothetical protein
MYAALSLTAVPGILLDLETDVAMRAINALQNTRAKMETGATRLARPFFGMIQ